MENGRTNYGKPKDIDELIKDITTRHEDLLHRSFSETDVCEVF